MSDRRWRITRHQAAKQFSDILSDRLEIGEAAKAVLPNAINEIKVIHTYEEAEYRHRFGVKVELLGPKKQELPHVEHWHEIHASVFNQDAEFSYVFDNLLASSLHKLVRSDTIAKLVLLYADEISTMKQEIDTQDKVLGGTFVPEIWSEKIVDAYCDNLALQNLLSTSSISTSGCKPISPLTRPEPKNRDKQITKHALDRVRLKRPSR